MSSKNTSDRNPALARHVAAHSAINDLANSFHALPPELKAEYIPHVNRLTKLLTQARKLALK